jgi:hypothetical protein
MMNGGKQPLAFRILKVLGLIRRRSNDGFVVFEAFDHQSKAKLASINLELSSNSNESSAESKHQILLWSRFSCFHLLFPLAVYGFQLILSNIHYSNSNRKQLKRGKLAPFLIQARLNSFSSLINRVIFNCRNYNSIAEIRVARNC